MGQINRKLVLILKLLGKQTDLLPEIKHVAHVRNVGSIPSAKVQRVEQAKFLFLYFAFYFPLIVLLFYLRHPGRGRTTFPWVLDQHLRTMRVLDRPLLVRSGELVLGN